MNVWPGDAVLYGFHQQTVRQVLRVSTGGDRLRLRLSNEYGASPIRIGAATVALAAKDGAVDAATIRQVRFGGERQTDLAPGAPLLSDVVDLAVPDLGQIAISLYFPDFAPIETYHYEAQQTAYISDFGNFAEAPELPLQQTSTSRYFLSAVLVESGPGSGSLACLGDSITDGFGSTIDGNARWPDRLAERLAKSGRLSGIGVLNQGIGGNRVLASRARGANALARFDRDVLSFPNVKWVSVLEGINDIGWPETMLAGGQEAVAAENLISAYRQIIARARLNGIKVLLGTLPPFGGAFEGLPLKTFYSASKERDRQAVNAWIRTSGEADAVVDFERMLADPANPSRLLRALDCGDGLHPSDDGYAEMAKAFEMAFEGLLVAQEDRSAPN
ncbi:SGNH/GDSL hydrolase family protein [Mesorhizobium sp. VK22B]|uniref:SGNH/GDSL hydrolase family protein n=2 Tax=Mesorhizobium captivum TaxID=3072319 RepID=A0ABU4Z8S3_9HYPH|nr:SGNH/GDSL hydrolase family protein [Mesorhizobium sp. VK22E]MDX8494690.1 SGNH/GDSL hydrolase family protein [Mesorhizobium sp. VK22B]